MHDGGSWAESFKGQTADMPLDVHKALMSILVASGAVNKTRGRMRPPVPCLSFGDFVRLLAQAHMSLQARNMNGHLAPQYPCGATTAVTPVSSFQLPSSDSSEKLAGRALTFTGNVSTIVPVLSQLLAEAGLPAVPRMEKKHQHSSSGGDPREGVDAADLASLCELSKPEYARMKLPLSALCRSLGVSHGVSSGEDVRSTSLRQ